MRYAIGVAGCAVALMLMLVAGCREEHALYRVEDPRPALVKDARSQSYASAIPQLVRDRAQSSRQVVRRTTYRQPSAAHGRTERINLLRQGFSSAPAEISVEADAVAVERAEILLLSEMDIHSIPTAPPSRADKVTSAPVRPVTVSRARTSSVSTTSSRSVQPAALMAVLPAPVTEEYKPATMETRKPVSKKASFGPEMEAGRGGVINPGEYSSPPAAEVTISYVPRAYSTTFAGTPELDSSLSDIGWVDHKWVESRFGDNPVGRMAY